MATKAKRKKKVSIETLQVELKDSLQSLGCLKVLSASSRHGDIRFMCRVEDTPRWEKALRSYLLSEVTEGDWYSFLGTKHMVINGRVVYGWVLIWESDDLEDTARRVRKIWSEVRADLDGQKPQFEVVSVNKPWEDTGYEEIRAGRTGTREG